MVSYKEYVAGWINSSIRGFVKTLPRKAASIKYALITCLDSDVEPMALLSANSEFRSLVAEGQPVGKGVLLPTRVLFEDDLSDRVFFGFDEVWFFPSEDVEPKPDAAWLTGAARIDQRKLDNLGEWMARNACSLALGDGEGLNFVVKASGLVRCLLGHSLDQPEPSVTFVASATHSVAG